MLKIAYKILFLILFFSQLSLAKDDLDHNNRIELISGLNLQSNQQVDFKLNKIFNVIVFLSARCPCSNSHIDEIKALAYEHKEFQFIAVHSNQNETIDEAKKYFLKQELPFVVIHDDKAKIADMFKAFKTPHVFVVNQTGEVVYKGGVSSSNHFKPNVKKYLREVLEDLKLKKQPRHTETRSLGCVILRENNN